MLLFVSLPQRTDTPTPFIPNRQEQAGIPSSNFCSLRTILREQCISSWWWWRQHRQEPYDCVGDKMDLLPILSMVTARSGAICCMGVTVTSAATSTFSFSVRATGTKCSQKLELNHHEWTPEGLFCREMAAASNNITTYTIFWLWWHSPAQSKLLCQQIHLRYFHISDLWQRTSPGQLYV